MRVFLKGRRSFSMITMAFSKDKEGRGIELSEKIENSSLDFSVFCFNLWGWRLELGREGGNVKGLKAELESEVGWDGVCSKL